MLFSKNKSGSGLSSFKLDSPVFCVRKKDQDGFFDIDKKIKTELYLCNILKCYHRKNQKYSNNARNVIDTLSTAELQ